MIAEKRQIAKIEWNDEKLDFIEKFGILVEQSGSTRMAGRVIGAILIGGKESYSTQDLKEALDASKASISNATRTLQQMGLLQKVGVRGERMDYYRFQDMQTDLFLQAHIELIDQMCGELREGMRISSSDKSGHYHSLYNFLGFHLWFQSKMPGLLEEWRKERESWTEKALKESRKGR